MEEGEAPTREHMTKKCKGNTGFYSLMRMLKKSHQISLKLHPPAMDAMYLRPSLDLLINHPS
eukprot:scaffold19_cov114-Cylindrotheca_fusiformis.AAC.50